MCPEITPDAPFPHPAPGPPQHATPLEDSLSHRSLDPLSQALALVFIVPFLPAKLPPGYDPTASQRCTLCGRAL